MRRIVLVGVAAAFMLSGCGSTPPGTIIEKEHEPSKTSVTTTCTTDAKGKRTCTPKPHPKPECWELEIKDDQGDEHEVCVSEREWNKWNVGDRYPGSK